MFSAFKRLKKERELRVKELLETTDKSYREIALQVSDEYELTLGSMSQTAVMNVNKKYKVRN